MKKLIVIAALASSTAAFAHGPVPRGGGQWLLPTIIAGALVYEAMRPPVVVQQPPVYVQPQPIYVQPPHNEYREPPLTQRPPAEVYVQPAPRYIERIMYDQTCGCYRKFLQQVD